jgi:hypothetical protein
MAQEKPARIFTEGVTYYKQSDYRSAETAFRRFLKAVPEDHPLVPVVKLTLGKALMGQDRSAEAVPYFHDYITAFPDSGEGLYRYATALFFSSDLQGCLPYFERAARLDPDRARSSLYYTGIANLKLGRTARGRSALSLIVAKAPDSREAESARAILDLIDVAARESAETYGRPDKEKPWSLGLSVGVEYDDNVVLLPDFVANLPADISSKDAWRVVHSIDGGYEWRPKDGHSLGVNVNHTGTHNDHLSDFDVDIVAGDVYWKYSTAPFQVRVTGCASYAWVASSGYNNNISIGPGLSYQPTSWTWTDADYHFGKRNFFDTPVDAREERDADYHYLSLKQNFLFPSLLIRNCKTFFSLGINYTINNTVGSSMQYEAIGETLAFQQEMPLDITLMCIYAFRNVRYDNANARSISNERRLDDEHQLKVKLAKKITEELTAYAAYRLYDNDSNIEDYYSYDSNIYSFGLNVNF